MMTIAVAGGAGFIGSHLCEFLLDQGHKVFALDNMKTGRRDNIEHLLKNRNFNWLEHDIRVRLHLNHKIDRIYNLASPASPVDFEKIPEYIMETASDGHRNLLRLAQENGARILFASTSEVYGDPLEHPQKETYLGNVDCTGIRACYDEAKRYGEALTMIYHRFHKVETRIIRIFNTYGPRMRPEDGRVIPNFCNQALRGEPLTVYGDGKQTRSLCYVSDMVRGMHSLMESKYSNPVNIGNPDEYSMNDLADKIIAAVGNKNLKKTHHPLPPSDPKRRKPDISLARKILGWEPQVSLAEGMKATLEYFAKEARRTTS